MTNSESAVNSGVCFCGRLDSTGASDSEGELFDSSSSMTSAWSARYQQLRAVFGEPKHLLGFLPRQHSRTSFV